MSKTFPVFLFDNFFSKGTFFWSMNMKEIKIITLLGILFALGRAHKDSTTCRDVNGNEITICNQCLWESKCEWCPELKSGINFYIPGIVRGSH